MTTATLDRAPYDEDGNLMHVASWGVHEWRDNAPFPAVLRVASFETTTDHSYFLLADALSGAEYPVLLPDLFRLLRERNVTHGRVAGRWIVKQSAEGRYYGLALVPDA